MLFRSLLALTGELVRVVAVEAMTAIPPPCASKLVLLPTGGAARCQRASETVVEIATSVVAVLPDTLLLVNERELPRRRPTCGFWSTTNLVPRAPRACAQPGTTRSTSATTACSAPMTKRSSIGPESSHSLPQGLVVHAFVHARPTTTWTEPDRS